MMTEIKESISRETVETAKALETYKYGFTTDIESVKAPKGLNEDTVRFISAKKEEPEWLLEWRLEAFKRWLTMEEPAWAMVDYPTIDYQDHYYYAEPSTGAKYESIDDVPPEILADFEKFKGKVLAGDYNAKAVMGEWDADRLVILDFPDKGAFIEWATSEEYQAIAKHRDAGADITMVLANGFESS